METRTLVGVWTLIAYYTQYDGGPRLYPLGEDAVGGILYTPDGFMSGTMQRARPEPFAVPDRLQATPNEKARAFDDYVAYCGRWRVAGDTAFHRIDISLLPNWIGQEQAREIRWLGPDHIALVGGWQIGDRRREAVVEWRRARLGESVGAPPASAAV